MKISVKAKKRYHIILAVFALGILIWDLKIIWDIRDFTGNHIKEYLHPVLPVIILFGSLNSYHKMKKINKD